MCYFKLKCTKTVFDLGPHWGGGLSPGPHNRQERGTSPHFPHFDAFGTSTVGPVRAQARAPKGMKTALRKIITSF